MIGVVYRCPQVPGEASCVGHFDPATGGGKWGLSPRVGNGDFWSWSHGAPTVSEPGPSLGRGGSTTRSPTTGGVAADSGSVPVRRLSVRAGRHWLRLGNNGVAIVAVIASMRDRHEDIERSHEESNFKGWWGNKQLENSLDQLLD